MDADLRRQLVNLIAFVVTVVLNGMAVALPLNGLTTAEISDRFPVLVTPAGYVFSIWSVIYLLLAAFTIWQALPRQRTDGTLRSIGYLPALAGVLNAIWVVLWHFEAFVLTVPVMLGLLLTLVAIHVRLRGAQAAQGAYRWLVGLPFSVYLGWITIATSANISQALYHAGYRGEELWAIIILAVGIAIAAVMLRREADPAYGLVVVWAYLGIAAKQTEQIVLLAALAGAIAVAVLVAYVLVAQRRTPSVWPTTT